MLQMTAEEPPPFVFSLPQKARRISNSGPSNESQTIANAPYKDPLQILIRQIPEEGGELSHDVGFVMWPSAIILARWICQHPSIVFGRTVTNKTSSSSSSSGSGGDILEIGAGCGLVGLTAAKMLYNHTQEQQHKQQDGDDSLAAANFDNASTVIFTDYNPQVLENLKTNIQLNGIVDENATSVVGLDFFDQNSPSEEDDDNDEGDGHNGDNLDDGNDAGIAYWIDMDGTKHAQVGLILAADILCYSNDATLVANTVQAALVEGGRAIILGPDQKHRFGVEEFPEECTKLGLHVNITNHKSPNSDQDQDCNTKDNNDADNADQQQILHDLNNQTSGYSDGYDFTMFTVDKPFTSDP